MKWLPEQKIFKGREMGERDTWVSRNDTDTARRRTEESKKGTAGEYFFLVTCPILSCPTYRPHNGESQNTPYIQPTASQGRGRRPHLVGPGIL